jgi:DNA ligase-associated metallophosphoesterase
VQRTGSIPPRSGEAGAPAAARDYAAITVAGTNLLADCAGALWWESERALIVADLHLEKGSAFAARGMLLPPYDTAETLHRLGLLVARYDPRLIIALGDNFHDGDGAARLADRDRASLSALQHGRDWIWIAGNHDPDAPEGVGGMFAAVVALGPLAFRHEPTRGPAAGEVAGHLHPCARLNRRGRAVVRRCFASDGSRMVMPAFGAYAGGLDIQDGAFSAVFGSRAFDAHLLGAGRIYALRADMC